MKKQALFLLVSVIAVLALSGTAYAEDQDQLNTCSTDLVSSDSPAPADVTNSGQAGTTLTAYVNATSSYTRTYSWDIDKSVNPETWDIFKGDNATSQYKVNVTKTGYTDEAVITGYVNVTNGGAVATENLAINLDLTKPPSTTVIGTYTVDLSSNPVLDPDETGYYPYKIVLTSSQIDPGKTYKVTANVTITNHSGHLNEPFGPSPSATTILPAAPTPVNDVIHVTDTNGGSWTFSDTGSETYTKTFYGTTKGTEEYENTATITETGQSASAKVTVNTYELEISKTASTSFDRTYKWTIDKIGDQSDVTVNIGGSVPVNYTVKVGVDQGSDSNWKVNGTVTIKNPAPMAATINSITDVVSPDMAASLTGLPTFPYTLAAGETLTLTYNATLPNALQRINNATLTQQNYVYSYAGPPTAGGTTDYSATADVIFGSTPTRLIDESINVSDDKYGSLGTVAVGDNIVAGGTYVFPSYTMTYGPFNTPGDYRYTNTASFITNDTKNTGSDSWTVLIHVRSSYGALTIGYWKTHAGFTGNNDDVVTPLLNIWLGTSGGTKSVQVTSASQAVTLLQMSGDASNGINKLYAQLLAAKLNIANGADGSPISSTIATADTFLATYNADNWSKLSKTQKALVLSWMNTLDKYNNGLL